MTLQEADKLHWTISHLEWVCYMLQVLQEGGEKAVLAGYHSTVVQDCRWYLLQRQHELVGTMRQTVEDLSTGEHP